MGWWRNLGLGSGEAGGDFRQGGKFSRILRDPAPRRRSWGAVEPLEVRAMMAIDWQSSDAVKSAILAAGDMSQYTTDQLSKTTSWVVGIHDMTQAGAIGSQVSNHSVGNISYLKNAVVWDFGPDLSAKDVASQLGKLKGVDYFFPLVPIQAQNLAVPNDPYFVDQWHLQNTGANSNGGLPGADANVVPAWDIAKGAGVVIGIVDDGLQHEHPDLTAQYLPQYSFDFNNGDTDPSPDDPFNNHGTSVAGVAAGKGNNSIGISGAAPDASLAGLQLIGGFFTDADAAAALTYHNQDIDIYNNSWGFNGRVFGSDFPLPLLLAAMEDSATTGRGGLGNVIVFAAGNSGNEAGGFRDVNFRDMQHSIYSITVAAIDHNGVKSYYSESGAAVFISAYSNSESIGITTTDRTGQDGYNADGTDDFDPFPDVDYTSEFGGTSSAAPLVSGVIALMLSANPNLSYRDVQEILVQSARKNDPTDAGWTVNGAGHHINNKYGFGAIDAFAAVQLAKTWTPVGSPLELTSGTIGVNQAVPDNNVNGVVSTTSISQNIKVERVEVVFDATIPDRGDLKVELVSPDGTSSILAPVNEFNIGSNYRSWVFSSVRDWGESSQGTWSLRVSDLDGNNITGTFNSWKLNIYGTTPVAPVAVNDFAAGFEEVPLAISVLANDIDTDGRVVPSSIQIVSQPANGTISVNPQTGVITYTGKKDFFGTDSFRYTVGDNTQGRSNIATVTVSLANVNDAPVAVADVGKTIAGAVTVSVLDNDYDVDSVLLPSTITVVSGPQSGSVTIDKVNGTITYTPPANFQGGDLLQYTITDSDGAVSEPGTIRFRVGLPVSLAGLVYVDNNGNGVRDPGEQGLPNVQLTLSKTDGLFTFTEKIKTGADGTFLFAEADNDNDSVYPTGTYTVTEVQPSAFMDGVDLPGTHSYGGQANDQFSSMVMAPGTNSTNWRFAERGLKADYLASYLGAHLFLASTSGSAINSIILDSATAPDALSSLAGVSGFKLATDPPGMALTVNGQKTSNSVVVVSVPGTNNSLSAPAIQTLNGKTYVFDSWSDGGASTRNVTAGSVEPTLTAKYRVLQGSTTNYSYVLSMATQLGIPAPGASQVDQITSQLAQGGSKADAAAALWNTADNMGQRVDALFQAFLHRAPDAATRTSYVSRLLNGASENDLAAEILSGVDYAQAGHLTAGDYVNGLYKDVLGRNADAGGLTAWVNQLNQGKSRADVAKGFLNSDERLNVVVEQFYHDLLGRQSDAGGKAAFVKLLKNGSLNLAGLAAQMLGSDEFSRRSNNSQLSTADTAFAKALYTDLTGHAPTSADLSSWSFAVSIGTSRLDLVDQVWDSSDSLGRQVEQLYQSLLHRPSDITGKAANIAKLTSGTSVTDLAQSFLTSTEYTQTHASNSAFVDGLYRDVLGRTADAGGKSSWVGALDQGRSRADVAKSFLTSDERYLKLIDGFYTSYLGRAADSGGRNNFLSGLKSGALSIASAAESLLASDEYFSRSSQRKL